MQKMRKTFPFNKIACTATTTSVAYNAWQRIGHALFSEQQSPIKKVFRPKKAVRYHVHTC